MAQRKSNHPVRLRGVVKLMNYAREQLAAGIPPEQHDAFRATVKQGLQTIETFCKQQRGKPERILPAQSYRAYQYLKSINLNKLPTPQGPKVAGQQKVRFTGIVARTQDYHQDFERILPEWQQASTEAAQQRILQPLTNELAHTVASITAQCTETGAQPADLPKPSRAAFQWMALLSDPDYLALHLDALSTLSTNVQQKQSPPSRSPKRSQAPITIRLYNASVAYSKKQSGEIIINEGYIAAPAEILDALARIVTDTPSAKDTASCKAFTSDEAFTDVLGALELTTPLSQRAAQGVTYDLFEVFKRVNTTYFNNEIAQPNLVWSDTHTFRKMGHYNFTTDTVQISLSLDDPQIPNFYIDFVMYHELLHKKLGLRVTNGRRYAHTSEFNTLERQYPHWDKVQAYLKARGKKR